MAKIFTIELAMKRDDNLETSAIEFTKALELPKMLFPGNYQFMMLRYDLQEEGKAIEDCHALNKKLEQFGFKEVEFRIKEI